ncbi:MAG: nucleotidyl transferase AbiEii/AbiGii toxin family protein [Gammaproteobacteria bacterium]|nr:nucleotidyl transferase AbiEii/AbiGii toxin family protein [Gammaproteobacteria bacterium]
MDRNTIYFKQALLLVQMLPVVAKESCFALKGGTAINLFVRELPRLSVDIDLVYLPIEPRNESLSNMQFSLERISRDINQLPNINAIRQDNRLEEMRIIVNSNDAQIKIEVSPVARGTLDSPSIQDVCESVEDQLGFASIQLVSRADLYGGKICAALDRQHPRDLFDVKLLLDNQELNRDVFDGFLTYLLSHNRPISELMDPNWKDISHIFHNEFEGMSFDPITLEELQCIPEKLMIELKSHFTQRDFDFLMSFKSSEPDWELAPKESIQHLPAIRWKLNNIHKIPKAKKSQVLKKLKETMTQWL